MKVEMKEMEYTQNRKCEILMQGIYEEYEFIILNLGTHPTAYVKLSIDHKYYNKSYDEIDIEVHGGLTFSENGLPNDRTSNTNEFWIGWDYAHCDDYAGYELGLPLEFRADGKKWTTKEIFEEVKDVIEQLGK